MPQNIVAYIDGGSRGNPGPAAAGFVLTNDRGNRLQAKGFFLGTKTNNVAKHARRFEMVELQFPIFTPSILIKNLFYQQHFFN